MSQLSLDSTSSSRVYPPACLHGGFQTAARLPKVILHLQGSHRDGGGHPRNRVAFVKKPKWTHGCINIVRVEYPTAIAVEDIAVKLDRSKPAVYSKARKLGLRRPPRRRPATVADEVPLSASKSAPIVCNGETATVPVDEAQGPATLTIDACPASEAPVPASESAPIVCNGETATVPVDEAQGPATLTIDACPASEAPLSASKSAPIVWNGETATVPVDEAHSPVTLAIDACPPDEAPLPASKSAPIVWNGEIKPPAYVLTPVLGRQCVWFPQKTERMMRLWLANVQGKTIAAVIGSDESDTEITPMAVHSKANRVGLPPRFGTPLINNIGVAREIDRRAAPLPKTIIHQRKILRLRMCPLSATYFYSENMNRLSNQAKRTKFYQAQGAGC